MISFVVAMSKHRVIGFHNRLPWHLPEDLKYFKQLTTGHTVIMGRKTYESIGKPLPNRKNVILTRDKAYRQAGCTVLHALADGRTLWEEQDVFVIGGAEIFQLFFPIADQLYITYIDHDFAGDTFFPAFSTEEWQLTESAKGIKNEKNPYDYYFQTYARKGM
ncbi:dihydrofolate reductase [Fodinisporobacter ferrooxydans]|uniref:Dihydrofolate reductase n=1 Tax=Fodinisporobacter ferrooxydans TaxID=2901836 RepID=A0ABY4CJ19_9BACL|nr:dihydrofolate reductase [Alicyclobacillaceae bacterium MYW30-H2]